jgi:hypothetical protein
MQTAVILNLTKKVLSLEDLKLGINSFTLVCRETKSDTLELNFDKILRALRVSIFTYTLDKDLALADQQSYFTSHIR